MLKKSLIFLLFIFYSTITLAQKQDTLKMLLLDMNMQIEATEAVNNMYNFKFKEADVEFNWFKYKYPNHPLPYFLLGVSQWWRIMPDIEVKTYDDAFFAYMDTTIYFAEKLYKANPDNIEASFFLAGAYGFKGRLHAERKNWSRATFAGKNAFKYLRRGKGVNELSPEFLFGDALFNYYAIWIRENYPAFKPILAFFPKGDKELGLKQLKDVAKNSFYSRTEAQYFLMRIYANEENNPKEAINVSKYLYETFPDNGYFHRYYTMLTYMLGQLNETERLSKTLLERTENNMIGYEATSGRYASYYLAYIYKYKYKDEAKAKEYYEKTVQYAEKNNAYDSGYYLAALEALAKIADKENNHKLAKEYYKKIQKGSKRKDANNKEAREYLKKYKKED